MVLLDDFVSVQNIINTSSEFAEVLKKHGITDPGKVVTTPLTVGFLMAKMAWQGCASAEGGQLSGYRRRQLLGAPGLKTWWRWSTLKRRKSSKSKKVR